MNREAWQATVHGSQDRTQLSDWHFHTFAFAPSFSGVSLGFSGLFWGFPGGSGNGKESTCQCRRCRFNPWVGKITWRRAWQLTPVFLPGKSHRQRCLMGYMQSMGSQKVGHDLVTNTHTLLQLWQSYVLGSKYTRLTQNLDPQRIRQAQMALKSHQQCRH